MKTDMAVSNIEREQERLGSHSDGGFVDIWYQALWGNNPWALACK